MLFCILGLKCDSRPLERKDVPTEDKQGATSWSLPWYPQPEGSPLTWKLLVFSSFLFGGCFGGSCLDTRTNTFLGISTSRRGWGGGPICLPPGCPLLCPSWQSQRNPHTGLRWHLWTPAQQYLEDEIQGAPVGYLKYLCPPTKTRKWIDRIF